MTNKELEQEMDKPFLNVMIVILSYVPFGLWGVFGVFLFFLVGYIYLYFKNRNDLYRAKLHTFLWLTGVLWGLLGLLWVAQ